MWQSESMLCGTPVVTTDLPGGAGVGAGHRDGGAGAPARSAALADALARVLTERSDTPPLPGKRAPQEVFRPELTLDAYERWYRGAGGGGAGDSVLLTDRAQPPKGPPDGSWRRPRRGPRTRSGRA